MEQDQDTIDKMIQDAVTGQFESTSKRLDDLEKSINLLGEGYSNQLILTKPLMLLRSLRMVARSPSQITSNQNDYDSFDVPVLRLNSDASRDITGLKNGTNGRLLLIVNIGTQNIVLKDESASSVAANRLDLHGSVDLTLNADDSVLLWYDSKSLRWRDINN